MHGHGEKPYLCTYEGCDRAQPGHGFPRQWNLRDHMRRVHNDNGTASQATISPTSSGSSSSSKAKKRKNDHEKATGDKPHRKSSGSHKSTSSTAGQTAALPQIEEVLPDTAQIDQWHRHQQALQTLVHGFSQPEDPQFLHSFKDAQTHLTAMGKISDELVSAKNANTYRRSWKQSG